MENPNQILIDNIIETIDKDLTIKKKSFATLSYANKILVENGTISQKDKQNKVLKESLENGLIPHAYKTENKPQQWRIPLSEDGKINYVKRKKTKKKTSNNNTKRPQGQSKPQNKHKIPYSLDRKRQAKHAWILVISTIAIAVLLSVFAEDTGKNSNNETRNNGYNNSSYQKSDVSNSNQNLIRNLNSKYIGKKYDMDIADELFEKYGAPETLKGTNNYVWIAYYPIGNFTMTETKGDYIIVSFELGRKPRK